MRVQQRILSNGEQRDGINNIHAFNAEMHLAATPMWRLWRSLRQLSSYSPPSSTSASAAAHPASVHAHETLTKSRSLSTTSSSVAAIHSQSQAPPFSQGHEASLQQEPSSSQPEATVASPVSASSSGAAAVSSVEHKRVLERLDDLQLFHGRLLTVLAIRFRLWAQDLFAATSGAQGAFNWDNVASLTLDVWIIRILYITVNCKCLRYS